MALIDETNKAAKESIEAFEFYVKELGYKTAREMTLKSTCLSAVINHVNNWRKQSKNSI